ncbi:MAG TPA: N-acyl-D-amino-acid deacylase [Proteobacteria bacterium]|nr:cytosine deaminase [bacterium BMS3Abin14]HDL54237.1 N-acyl-D-amino-acid deacylase [Pseudomonadota bacterium]
MRDLLLRNARVSDDQDLTDISVEDGVITGVAPQILSGEDIEIIDIQGHVVIPSLVESHLHPDKALLEERMPNVSGTLAEAIHNTGVLKAKYTLDDVIERAETVLRWSMMYGSTIMRAHPDVDPIAKLLGVQALLELRKKYAGYLDLQIVVFPQEGIIKAPDTLELMEEGIRLGADVVGACPYNETDLNDTNRHLEIVFKMAEKHGLPLDMHVDFTDDVDDPRYMTTETICDMTTAYGMQGKVALGHVTTLGALDVDKHGPLFDKIAKADVTIMPLPATDIYLNGRKDKKNVRRGMAPVQALLQHGVNVVFASNNIRNAFTPFGNGNLLPIGYLLAETHHMGSAEQQREVLKMATYNAAKCLGIEDTYGIAKGKKADLVVFDSSRLCDVIQDQPLALYVIKGGRVVVENQLETKLAEKLR